ncbi:hypothetical protein P280DRAFT_545995 [Massarina eburnea CBS 473.64]|uniref:Uncharacterized protein n=1 Tax=Massarina eburnea CBS 473.64 TaxID=1395130 RepID=A0A6A6S9Y2_9PLEO|nr:hypothetical protein P280DRAFT_545995 [Massarina eburnea CBS 473.64]
MAMNATDDLISLTSDEAATPPPARPVLAPSPAILGPPTFGVMGKAKPHGNGGGDSFADLMTLMRTKPSYTQAHTQFRSPVPVPVPVTNDMTFSAALTYRSTSDISPTLIDTDTDPDSDEQDLDRRLASLRAEVAAVKLQETETEHPVVRVTQGVWDTMMAEISSLKNELCDRDVSVGKLRYQLTANKDYKAAMGRELNHKEAELYKKDLEIHVLQEKLSKYEATLSELEQCKAELGYLRTTKSNEETHVKNERLIKQRDQKLHEANNLILKWQDRYEDLRESLPSRKAFQDLQAELTKKSKEVDLHRERHRHTNRHLELALVNLQKSKDGMSLRGAYHLIVPSGKTTLPKLVFPCIECFMKNGDCDDKNQCQNCENSGEKCARFRCSIRHITLDCQETPCRLLHDANGWVMLKQQRSQW